MSRDLKNASLTDKPRSPNVQPVPSHTPATKRKMSSSRNSERNTKFHKTSPAQKPGAALVRHTDMAHKLFNYVQTDDIKKSTIKKSTLFNNKMYHGLLNDNKHISYDISISSPCMRSS